MTQYATYLIYKGTATAAALSLAQPKVGWVYDISEGGTLTPGDITVQAGDAVVYLRQGWTHCNNGGADQAIAQLTETFNQLLETIGEADLTKYALKTEIPTVPQNVSAFNNDAGYLTSHQSLAEYAKKSEIPDVTYFAPISSVPTKVSQLQNDARYLNSATVNDRLRKVPDLEADTEATDGEVVIFTGETEEKGCLYQKRGILYQRAAGSIVYYVEQNGKRLYYDTERNLSGDIMACGHYIVKNGVKYFTPFVNDAGSLANVEKIKRAYIADENGNAYTIENITYHSERYTLDDITLNNGEVLSMADAQGSLSVDAQTVFYDIDGNTYYSALQFNGYYYPYIATLADALTLDNGTKWLIPSLQLGGYFGEDGEHLESYQATETITIGGDWVKINNASGGSTPSSGTAIHTITAASISHDLDNIETSGFNANDIVIITDLSASTPLSYTYNDTTKTLYGSPDFDVPFRYVGSAGFKPIMFPFLF